MSTATTATRRSSPAPGRCCRHHPRVHQVAPYRWVWACSCGSGVHDPNCALPDQHAAAIASIVHVDAQPGA